MPLDLKDFEEEEGRNRSLAQRGLAAHRRLTTADLSNLGSLPRRIGVMFYRYLILLLEGIQRTELTRRAAALTYTTILSIFPLLAIISFIVSFYYDEQKEDEFIAWIVDHYIPTIESEALVFPQTEESQNIIVRSQEIQQNFVDLFTTVSSAFRDSTAGFGVFGFIGLLVTCGILYWSIESVVNLTWRSSHAIRWTNTLTNFFTVLFFAPIILGLSVAGSGLAFSILSVADPAHDVEMVEETSGETAELNGTASGTYEPPAPARSPSLLTELFRWLARTLGVTSTLIPIMINAIILSVAFCFIPRTRVLFHYAFIGALVSAVLWEIARYQFISYIYLSTINRTLTDVLGISVIFLIWLYITWLILLLGILVSYTAQNFEALWVEKITGQQLLIDGRILVALMLVLAAKFESRGGGGLTETELRKRLGLNQSDFHGAIEHLIRAGQISVLEDRAYQVAHPPEETTAREILALGCNLEQLPVSLRSKGKLPAVMAAVQKQSLEVFGDRTLLDLLGEQDAPEGAEA